MYSYINTYTHIHAHTFGRVSICVYPFIIKAYFPYHINTELSGLSVKDIELTVWYLSVREKIIALLLPIDLFLVPPSAPRLVYQRLWDDAYKRTLAANRKE